MLAIGEQEARHGLRTDVRVFMLRELDTSLSVGPRRNQNVHPAP